jgi:hypothetical protein
MGDGRSAGSIAKSVMPTTQPGFRQRRSGRFTASAVRIGSLVMVIFAGAAALDSFFTSRHFICRAQAGGASWSGVLFSWDCDLLVGVMRINRLPPPGIQMQGLEIQSTPYNAKDIGKSNAMLQSLGSPGTNGFWLIRCKQPGAAGMTASYWAVGAPAWFIGCIGAVSPTIWISRTAKRKLARRSGMCPDCGYDLRATPGRCPECGRVPAG